MGRKTTDRALSWAHQERRAALHAAHVEGTPCWWCGLPMYRTSQRLEPGHSIPQVHGADQLLHAHCNSQRGDGKHDHLRPALPVSPDASPRTSREW